jgi:hypothetical protein
MNGGLHITSKCLVGNDMSFSDAVDSIIIDTRSLSCKLFEQGLSCDNASNFTRESPGSNLTCDSGYPDSDFRDSPQSRRQILGEPLKIRPRPSLHANPNSLFTNLPRARRYW